mmetsp:Transcript_2990/g.10734  ORF Transcript_2990/g.10734 Transcript_2990/m.10734 type:complete len:221 (-) Transcript_2990:296-958(-)
MRVRCCERLASSWRTSRDTAPITHATRNTPVSIVVTDSRCSITDAGRPVKLEPVMAPKAQYRPCSHFTVSGACDSHLGARNRSSSSPPGGTTPQPSRDDTLSHRQPMTCDRKPAVAPIFVVRKTLRTSGDSSSSTFDHRSGTSKMRNSRSQRKSYAETPKRPMKKSSGTEDATSTTTHGLCTYARRAAFASRTLRPPRTTPMLKEMTRSAMNMMSQSQPR